MKSLRRTKQEPAADVLRNELVSSAQRKEQVVAQAEADHAAVRESVLSRTTERKAAINVAIADLNDEREALLAVESEARSA